MLSYDPFHQNSQCVFNDYVTEDILQRLRYCPNKKKHHEFDRNATDVKRCSTMFTICKTQCIIKSTFKNKN